jgi:hypothetical protein
VYLVDLVLKDLLEAQAPQAQLEVEAHKVLLDQLDHLVQVEHKVLEVLKAQLEVQVNLVL